MNNDAQMIKVASKGRTSPARQLAGGSEALARMLRGPGTGYQCILARPFMKTPTDTGDVLRRKRESERLLDILPKTLSHTKPVLIVGMGNSSHLVSYCSKVLRVTNHVQFFNIGGSHIYQLPEGVEDITSSWARTWIGSRLLWWLDRMLLRSVLTSHQLRREITNRNFQVLIAHDLQRAGYPLSNALAGDGVGSIFHGVSLGNDLFWYPRLWWHKRRLGKLASSLDSIEVECAREVATLATLGFRGTFFSVKPNSPVSPTGSPEARQQVSHKEISSEKRPVICIKGYGGKWGQGWKAILSCLFLRQELDGFQIVVYSASRSSRFIGRACRLMGMDVEFAPKLGRWDFLQLLQRAHVHIGISRSDGLATTSLEAAMMGAYVIQSESSCIGDYLSGGTNYYGVKANSIAEIASLVSKVLKLPPSMFSSDNSKLVERLWEEMSYDSVARRWRAEFSKLIYTDSPQS